MKRNVIGNCLMVVPILVLTACSGSVAASQLERDTDPQILPSEVAELVAGNTGFGFDLYQAWQQSPGNMIFSPYSISQALAMTYAGARGETASQMATSLHFDLAGDVLHRSFNALDLDLLSRPGQVQIPPKEQFQLTIANSLWGQQDWTFLPEFLDLLAVNYGAGMRLVDFQKDPPETRRQINQWTAKETGNRIKDLLPPGLPDPLTRLALVNAIYFKATWEYEFDAGKTSPGLFTLLDGSTTGMQRMRLEHAAPLEYAIGEGWQAVSLPYKGGLLDMLILLPDLGEFEKIEATMDAEQYQAISSALKQEKVLLSMPKFDFENTSNLKETLISLGMPLAFDKDRADFSGMDGMKILYIGEAIHKAFITVDEEGTEAGAATIVLMLPASMPQGIVLDIDRPFLFFIRDIPSGTILFMGRLVDPG